MPNCIRLVCIFCRGELLFKARTQRPHQHFLFREPHEEEQLATFYSVLLHVNAKNNIKFVHLLGQQ